MRSRLAQLTRSAALPAAVAVVVLGAGSAFAATSLVGSSSTPTPSVAEDEPTSSAPSGTDGASTAPGAPTTSETGKAPTGAESADAAGEAKKTGSAAEGGTVTCETARNHGAWVSYVARTTPKGDGFSDAVREAAHSDCGKKNAADPSAPGKSGENHGNKDKVKDNGKSGGPHGKAHQPHGNNQGKGKKN